MNRKRSDCEESKSDEYPTYRKSDLQGHRTMESRIWVAYKDSVYDITDFIKMHPGGSEKILLGAGSNLEPFFAFYPFHAKDNVQKLLAKFKIGVLHPDDRIKEEDVPKFDATTIVPESSKDLIVL